MTVVTSVNTLPAASVGAVAWLNAILLERFGVPLELRHVEDQSHWVISLNGAEGSPRIYVDSNCNGETRCGGSQNVPKWDAEAEGWRPVLNMPLPAPGIATLPDPVIERRDDGYQVHYDILGLVYWMLTRVEEVGRSDLDEHGRFPATASHAFWHGYLERPIVDEWLDILGQVIQRTWPGIELKQHCFSMQLSHDVDAPSRYGFCSWKAFLRAAAADLLKYRDVRAVAGPWVRLHSRTHLHPMDAFNTFDWIMDASERHGVRDAFYFICDRRGTIYDSDYDLEHPAIRCLIRRIHSRGHEIGLHPSYGSFLESEQIRLEAERLRSVCDEEGVRQMVWGGRMHYLQWRQPVTLRAWNDAGMTYDSTMGYADHTGFRCGTCFEYPAFDPVAQKALRVRIRPLVVMEGTVFGEKYMGLGVTEAACNKMLQLKEVCKRVGGSFTLLWHNSSLHTEAQRAMYEVVLAA